MEGRVEYRSSGGLDFQHSPLLLDPPTGEYSHLQRSIDTLRSLSERNVDFRLNLNQDLRNLDLRTDRYNDRSSPMDNRNLRNQNMNGLELNLSMSQDRLNDHNRLNLDTNLRNLQLDRSLLQDRPLHLDREIDRIQIDRNIERSLSSERLNLDDRITPNSERLNNDRLNTSDINQDYNNKDMSDKYKEYRNHLDCLRGIDGRNDQQQQQQDEGRGTPSTPPTPVSVGENNYQEEKVRIFDFLYTHVAFVTYRRRATINTDFSNPWKFRGKK